MESKKMTAMSSTLLKGRITELKCELWLLEHGFLVSTPEIPYQYDFLVDVGRKILKIQVKTCTPNEDCSNFAIRVCSITHNNKGYVRRNYSEDNVDYFMTCFKDNCYLIPFSECGVREKRLRLTETKSGQVKNINFAEDYLAEKILNDEVNK